MIGRVPRETLALVALTLVVLASLVSLALGAPRIAAQADHPVTWSRYDVRIELEPDGALLVTERFEVAFSGATSYSFGFADIPLIRIDALEVIGVAEQTAQGASPFTEVEAAEYSRQPGTYLVEQGPESVSIEYAFTPANDETRAFALTYRARGALRVYGDGANRVEQIWWTAISTDVTAVGPVTLASITVVLPSAVSTNNVRLGASTIGPAGRYTDDGRTWRWEAAQLLSGDEFVVRMELPALTNAEPPAWQQAETCERARQTSSVPEWLVFTLLGLVDLGDRVDCRAR